MCLGNLLSSVQRSAKKMVSGCEKFVPALACLFYLALPWSCLARFAYFLADLCTITQHHNLCLIYRLGTPVHKLAVDPAFNVFAALLFHRPLVRRPNHSVRPSVRLSRRGFIAPRAPNLGRSAIKEARSEYFIAGRKERSMVLRKPSYFTWYFLVYSQLVSALASLTS